MHHKLTRQIIGYHFLNPLGSKSFCMSLDKELLQFPMILGIVLSSPNMGNGVNLLLTWSNHSQTVHMLLIMIVILMGFSWHRQSISD